MMGAELLAEKRCGGCHLLAKYWSATVFFALTRSILAAYYSPRCYKVGGLVVVDTRDEVSP